MLTQPMGMTYPSSLKVNKYIVYTSVSIVNDMYNTYGVMKNIFYGKKIPCCYRLTEECRAKMVKFHNLDTLENLPCPRYRRSLFLVSQLANADVLGRTMYGQNVRALLTRVKSACDKYI